MMSEWSQDGGSFQLTLTDLSSPLCALSLSTCANEQAKFPLKRRAAFLFANNFFFLFNSLNSSSNSHYNIHNSQLCLIGEGERHTETSSKKTCRQLLCSVIDSRIYFLSLFFLLIPITVTSQGRNNTISTKTASKWPGHSCQWTGLHNTRKLRRTITRGKYLIKHISSRCWPLLFLSRSSLYSLFFCVSRQEFIVGFTPTPFIVPKLFCSFTRSHYYCTVHSLTGLSIRHSPHFFL